MDTHFTPQSNELYDHELLFGSLFYHSTDAIEIIDMNGHVVDLNPTCSVIFGVNREQTIGKKSNLFQYVENRTPLDLSIHTVEDYIKGQNGITYFARMIFSPILNKLKEKIGYSIIIRDKTTHQQLIHSLKENEQLYRLLADNSQDLIQIVNLEGKIVYTSPSHKKILGYDPEEYAGNNINVHSNGDFRQIFKQMSQELKTVNIETKAKHKNGHELWIEIKGTPVYDKEGNFEHFMLVGHDITDRKINNERLQFLATHDPLTKLPNRRLFSKELKAAINQAHRPIAVMILDIDGFKEVNDDYGHDVGDELLKVFSQRVNNCIREEDILARVGGDEFVLLLSDLENNEQALMIAERIINRLQDKWVIDDQHIQITCSIGIAFDQTHESINDFIKRADLALYEAKSKGKNTYIVTSE